MAGLLLLVVTGSSSAAQRQPVVYQHGFMSDEYTWANSASSIMGMTNTMPHMWNTTWNNRLFRQAQTLHNFMSSAGLPDSTIVVAHSNGGLVSRRLSSYRHLRGLITVGTPHQGAMLAGSVLDGSLTTYGAIQYATPYSVWHEYAQWVEPVATDRFELTLGFLALEFHAGFGLAITAASATFMTRAILDEGLVLHDMAPSAPNRVNGFLEALNSGASIAAEAQQIDHRISISSNNTEWFPLSIWQALQADDADLWTAGTYAVISDEMFMFDYYSSYSGYDETHNSHDQWADMKRQHAPMWLMAGVTLATIQYAWCEFISGGGCVPSDAVVPVSATYWPGATNIPLPTSNGPIHNHETSDITVRNQIVQHLRFTIGVVEPPTLSATIDGSNPGYQGNYSFTAVPQGAPGPYTYRWYRSYEGGGFSDTGVTSQSYTAYYYAGSYALRVDVTAPGAAFSANRSFSVACNQQPCVF